MGDFDQAERRIVETAQALTRKGYLMATGGNLSVRIPGMDALAVTPSDFDYLSMTPEDVCVLDFDLRPLAGKRKPSVESAMHAGVYRARGDVNAVIHTHQVYASALALMKTPIPALFDEQVRFLGRSVDLIPYAPSGTGMLKNAIVKSIRNHHNAYLMQNHGALCFGDDLERAVHNVEILEKCALAYLLTLMAEKKADRVPLAIRELAFARLRRDQSKAEAEVREGGEGNDHHAEEQQMSGDQACAISTYPDTDEVYRRLDALVSRPMRPVKREKMREYLDYFAAKCARSRDLTEEAKKIIPGGVQHNLAFNYPFPIAIEKAEGAFLWDVDGNRYIDFLQAGGPTILGSNYAPVRDRVFELLKTCGPVTGLFHEYELKLARLIQRFMPSIEMFRMLGSGTEGVMAAIRAARAFTKKRYVIKAGGAYHGWSDQMVFGLHVPGTGRREAKGIPGAASGSTLEFFPTSLGALRRRLILNRLRGGTAAVILEPVGPESGTRPVPYDFCRKVRELCDEFGCLLIFDEVVTGFRLGLGGAQGYFGVRPDLTVFGKCITGGYPMAGGVGGRADVITRFAPGIGGSGERAYVGGTLSANPLSCAAGYHALLEMERTNAPVLAGAAGDRLTRGLQAIIAKHDLPFVAFNQGSIVHLETSGVMLLDFRNPLRLVRELKPRTHMIEEMGAAYMANGMVTLAGSRMYTSMADTDAIIDEALQGFETVLSSVEGV